MSVLPQPGLSPGHLLVMDRIYGDVLCERARQWAERGSQYHLPLGTGEPLRVLGEVVTARGIDPVRAARRRYERAAANGTLTLEHILTEEVVEALDESDPQAFRAEAVQVIAVLFQMIEKIDTEAEQARE